MRIEVANDWTALTVVVCAAIIAVLIGTNSLMYIRTASFTAGNYCEQMIGTDKLWVKCDALLALVKLDAEREQGRAGAAWNYWQAALVDKQRADAQAATTWNQLEAIRLQHPDHAAVVTVVKK